MHDWGDVASDALVGDFRTAEPAVAAPQCRGQSHLADALSLDEVAAIGGISRFHKVRAFAAADYPGEAVTTGMRMVRRMA
jgi:hypothetical protein